MNPGAPWDDPSLSVLQQRDLLLAQWQLALLRAEQLQKERDEYRTLVALLREENERLKRGLLGQKAERLPRNDAQLSLAILGLALGAPGTDSQPLAPPPPPTQPVAPHTRRKPVRKPLPPELPRVVIELTPPEVQRAPQDFHYIGCDTREVLERRPAATVVVQLVYKKFVANDSQPDSSSQSPPTPTVLVAPTVELPIERGLAGPGLLADSLVRRFQDHQPLHRLEGIYGREGLHLRRSTLGSWHQQLAQLARPLVAAMFRDAMDSPCLCTDATGVLVLDKERCRTGHFWVLVAPGRHVLYRYSPGHNKAAVDQLLAGYKGFLVADAHAVYDHLFADGSIVEVGCWSHCRRYFIKALDSDPDRAKTALSYITALFLLERQLARASPEHRLQVRQEKSRPLVDAFFLYCQQQREHVVQESPLWDALRYARNQEQALRRFLTDGRLPLHNNSSELALRRQVLGRRNWLFCGSDQGAEVNTLWVSLLASCRLHGIEPLSYLRDLLCLLPSWPASQVLQLAPLHWAQTQQQPQTQQKLRENLLRGVLLSQLP